MDEQRITGAAKQVAGKVQSAFGDVVGDDRSSIEGRAREAAGKVESWGGEATDLVLDTIKKQPLVAVGAALGVGFLLGMLAASRQ